MRRVSSIALGVLLLMVTILFVVSDGNDYAEATLDKHKRLDELPSPKIVFVGGSNLSYGLDSEMLEHSLGYRVVNMGMNAYLGVRFLIDEVTPSLEPGDVLVLSFEGEMFRVQDEFDAVDGRSSDLFMLVKTRPASLEFVPWPMRLEIIRVLPQVVQLKTTRIIGDIGRLVVNGEPNAMDQIESRAGFNAYGDLVSHIGVQWADGLDQPMDLAARSLDQRVPTLLGEIHAELGKRDIRMFILPPPMPEHYYDAQARAVAQVSSEVEKAVPHITIAPQSRYVFAESCFFDDVHHLTGECRAKRTALVAEDLARVLQLEHAVASPMRTAE